jgi:hydroxymethylbilane synthase
VKLGTRGSALALAQAQPIADRLGAELVVIRTSGDGGNPVGDKQRWVDRIEEALLSGSIDVAVHSAKDVPGELAAGLAIVAAAAREDPRDVLIGAPSLDALPQGARVGTSSPRRRAQLLAARDDIDVVPITGNVDTRLRKLADGEVQALVLAAAGLARLGRASEIGTPLQGPAFVPAPGQGILAIEARPGFDASAVADADALRALERERAVARALGADCESAIGVHAEGDVIRAWVGAPDGSAWISDEVVNATPELITQRLESMGARTLLEPAP